MPMHRRRALRFIMSQIASVHPDSERAVYLGLFITNGGGW